MEMVNSNIGEIMSFLNFTFGLLLFHFLYWIGMPLFLLFVVIPWCMGLVNGKGYRHNAGEIGHFCMWILSAGFKKRPEPTV